VLKADPFDLINFQGQQKNLASVLVSFSVIFTHPVTGYFLIKYLINSNFP